MAKFKTDTAFYGTKEAKEFEAGAEFEMNIDRAKEVVANGKKNHNLDIKLTRLDGEQPKEIEKVEEDKKEAAKKTTKKAGEDK